MTDIHHLRLLCTGCSTALRIGIADAGKSVQCPNCAALTLSPTAAQVEQLRALAVPTEMLADAGQNVSEQPMTA